MRFCIVFTAALAFMKAEISAFSSSSRLFAHKTSPIPSATYQQVQSHLPLRHRHGVSLAVYQEEGDQVSTSASEPRLWDESGAPATYTSAAAIALAALMATPANAAAADASFYPIASALVAYVHYASFIVSTGCLVTERLTIKPSMSEEEEKRAGTADAIYGLASVALVVSGYFRAVDYGKGWEFYSHEPVFWLKLVLYAIVGGASLFPTTTILKRASERNMYGTIEPMSEKLAGRMTTLVNAQLLAFLSIPLAATLMARGVGGNWFPWQAGAGLVLLTFGGLGYKYLKEALDWKEESVVVIED